MKNLKSWVLSGFATMTLALTGCAPECVDVSDCAAKSAAEGRAYTCVSGNCQPGSPFTDAGLGGGGGTTGGGGGTTGGGGGSTGGGGGMTGGGGGGDADAGTDAGMDVDAGTDAGMDVDAGMDAGMDVDAGIDAGMEIDAGIDAGMDVDAGIDAGMEIDAGIDAGSANAIAFARAVALDGGQTPSVVIPSATVTFLRPAVGTVETAGFFVQEGPTGPAIFVFVDPSTLSPSPQVGDVVSFQADTFSTTGGLAQVATISNYQRLSSGASVTGLTQDLTAVANVAAGLNDLEAELISIRGVIDGGFTNASPPFVGAFIATAAGPAANVRFRVPQALVDSVELERGCDITVGPTPMWRNFTQAQPSAWQASDFTIHSCPAPTVVSALATSPTSVTVTFSRSLAPGSVLADGSQFTFDNGLTASAAAVSGRAVVLTTAAQTGGTSYTVTVATSVTDNRSAPVGVPNTAAFIGFQTPARLRINELNANINSGCDLIELRVLEGGSLNNISVLERDATVIILPNVTVAKNDLVVIHFNGTAGTTSTCNPGGSANETTSANQLVRSMYGANFDTAWDFYSNDTGLTNTDNTITLASAGGAISDVVLIANLATGTAAAASESAAALAAAAMQWQMNGGGVPAAGFVDTDFRAHAVLDCDATGTTATGESLRRIDDTDDNEKSDWAQGASTFGGLNAGQAVLP